MGKESKAFVRLNGTTYRLRFDLWALEQIEDEFGGIREVFERLSSGKSMVKTARSLFKILANSQRNMDGMPEDVTGNEISAHMSVAELNKISAAMKEAITEGMKAETVNGEADDEVHDGYREEYERKKTEAGEQPAQESSTVTR